MWPLVEPLLLHAAWRLEVLADFLTEPAAHANMNMNNEAAVGISLKVCKDTGSHTDSQAPGFPWMWANESL